MEVSKVNLECYYCGNSYTKNNFYWVKTRDGEDVTICPPCAKKPLTNNNK